MKLYMFRTVHLPIIRSLITVLSAVVCVIQVGRHLSSRTRMELSSILVLCARHQGIVVGWIFHLHHR